MNFINGVDRVIFIKLGDDYLPIGCLTDNSFSESATMLSTTTRDSPNGWETSRPVNQNYTIGFSGLLINTNFAKGDFTKISYDRLRVLKRSRVLIDWKISDVDLLFVDYGKGHISSLSDSSEIDDYISFDCEIVGYGEPISTSEKTYSIQDGDNNIIEDGNNNEITN